MSGFVLVLVFFVPMLLVAVKSVHKIREKSDLLTLPPDSCGALRGYMALIILWTNDTADYFVVNGVRSYPYTWLISALRSGMQDVGILFVGIFFALSTYGCRKKWRRDSGELNGFLTKRVVSVYFPYLLIGTALGLLRKIIWGGVTYTQLFLNLFDFNVWPVHWYILYALLLYVLFYCVYSSVKRHPDSVFCALIVCYIAYSYITKKNELYYVSCVGAIIGILYEKIEERTTWKKRYMWYMAGSAIAFLAIYCYPYVLWTRGIVIQILDNGPVYRITSASFFCVFVFLMLHFIDFSRSKWLGFCGKISLEIYLVHSFVIMLTEVLRETILVDLSYSASHGVKTLLTILLTVVFSFALHGIIEKSKKYILTKGQ